MHKNKKDLYKYQINRWRNIKIKAVKFMGGSCVRCGYNDHPAALQFHHLDPSTKLTGWTKLRLKSWNKITEELQKCIMLCANCHSIEHTFSKYD
jgi:hypothetical protein